MKRLANINNKTIEVVKTLTLEESQLIISHIDCINSLNERIFQIMEVVKIYDEIKTSIDINSHENLYRLIREFLSNFSSFIDYWEKRISSAFGKQSEQLNYFSKKTNDAYDKVFAYRFICGLRNYIEHYELPQIMISSKLDKGNNKIHSLTLNSKKLLANSFNWKKNVKLDLDKLDTDIDLLETFQIVIKSLKIINDTALSFYNIENDLVSCKKILDYEYLVKEGFELVIADFPKDYPDNLNGSLSVWELPFNLAKHFLKHINISEE